MGALSWLTTIASGAITSSGSVTTAGLTITNAGTIAGVTGIHTQSTTLDPNSASGGALTITNTKTQTSGDLVTITGTANQTALNVVMGNVSIAGNLVVNGTTTTTVESTAVSISVPIITLGENTVDDSKDLGVEIKYNDVASKTGFIGRDDSSGTFAIRSVPQFRY